MAKKKSKKSTQSTGDTASQQTDKQLNKPTNTQTTNVQSTSNLQNQATPVKQQTISYSSIAQKSQNEPKQSIKETKQQPTASKSSEPKRIITELEQQPSTPVKQQTISYSSIAQKSQNEPIKDTKQQPTASKSSEPKRIITELKQQPLTQSIESKQFITESKQPAKLQSIEPKQIQSQQQKPKKLSKRQQSSKKQIVDIQQATTSRSIDNTDSLFSSLKIDDSGDNLTETKFATKKYGSAGEKVELITNFFKINLNKESNIYYHYNIEIQELNSNTDDNKKTTPKSKKSPKHLNNTILEELFKKFNSVFQNESKNQILPAFDGSKNLYTLNKLNFEFDNNENDHTKWSNKLTVRDKDKDINFIINLTIPAQSHCKSLSNLLLPNQPIMPVELQALDIIMRNGPRINKIQLGQNFFLKSNDNDFPFKDEIIKYGKFGYYQNTKILEKGIYYNVDRAINVFQSDGKLIDKIQRLGYNLREIINNKRDLNRLEEEIKSLKCRLIHLDYTKHCIINGLSKKAIKDVPAQFEVNGQKVKNVLEYFNKKYPRVKLDPQFPAVKVGSKTYYPIEVCYLEKDEVYRRKLNQFQQSEITKISAQTPLDRFNGILNHVNSLNDDSTINGVNYLDKFGISVDVKPLKVEGRILSGPKIQYGNKELMVNNGTWDVRGCSFVAPSSIGENWAIINFYKLEGYPNRSSINRDKFSDIIKHLIHDAKCKGIDLSAPIHDDAYFEYRGVNTLEHDLFNKLNSSIKLVFLLIPHSGKKIYDEIKAVSELRKGLITQCLDQKNWFRCNGQLASNIMLKVNPKTNGVNHKITSKIMPNILKKESKLMIIGIDVTHPDISFTKSVGAVVGTYTDNYDKCYYKTMVQEEARKELMTLKKTSEELLDFYKKSNNQYPERIIVYRDGVGDGYFEKVLNHELKAIQDACGEKNIKIKITYIMVQKRHNTRMYPSRLPPNPVKAIQQNMKAGTVVDKDMTNHKFFEFYLCSHAGAMGTSRPSKYVVLLDENNLTADELQQATYYLTYLYPRCTKSISIPPMVQYAHLLAKRGKSYLSHFDEIDAKSSVSSDKGLDKLSAAQTNDLNRKITVDEKIKGRLFFI